MATRSDAPLGPVPATGALGQEAVVAAALAEPQLAEQLAALTDPASLPAPSDQVAAPSDNVAAPVGGDDRVPQVAAVDPTGQGGQPDALAAPSTTDLTPVMGAVPLPTSEATVGHITVTTLHPDFAGLPAAPLAPLFTAPLGDPLLRAGFGGLTPVQTVGAPLHTSPQDHSLMPPEAHPAPLADTHAPAPVSAAPPAPIPVPASAPAPAPASAPAPSHVSSHADTPTAVAGGDTPASAPTADSGAGLVMTVSTVHSVSMVLGSFNPVTFGPGDPTLTVPHLPHVPGNTSGLVTSSGFVAPTAVPTPTSGLAAGYSVADPGQIHLNPADPHAHA
jgi:hypothetical protein